MSAGSDRSVTIEDYLPPSGLTQIWPRRCSRCHVICHDLPELTDEDHHDWPDGRVSTS
jgi:hypothetical protein